MSFVGSAGASMEGSELEKPLQQVHGTNTVSHMMSGKAISKALRGHYLIDSALYMTLFDLLMLQNEPSLRGSQELEELVIGKDIWRQWEKY